MDEPFTSLWHGYCNSMHGANGGFSACPPLAVARLRRPAGTSASRASRTPPGNRRQRWVLGTLFLLQFAACFLSPGGRREWTDGAEIRESHADLVGGNERLPGVFSAALHELYFGSRKADERIRQFIALAGRALVAQATPLLKLLQEITLAYQHEMRGIEATGLKRQVEIAEQLGSISMQANIVALNARISAARAGHHGREFAVLTTVLADIIQEMDALIHRVVDPASAGGTATRPGAPVRDRQWRADRALQ